MALKKFYFEIGCLWIVFWSSRGVNFVLKEWIKRDRPSLHPLIDIGDYSFPSGHSMNSIATLGFLCYLLIIISKGDHKWKIFWSLFTGIMVFLIVISRLYLGVHYPSDVLAGLAVGYLLLVCFLPLFSFIQKKRLADRP
ncbi:phosphatase PAP2 family protein [Lederbergia sp. NSJ-179]|uniref:phosphatase PAP2 family protein n=1 Tax=Lederbergia sp. NSJ-179 TaxID=2931402 RepID=UPI001FD0C6D3|nr:phosphatase PAP2 family protein [Lederbergia sp. NSJ-179]MCJ7842753.1 phosphatase PAP2 family protein [Lederbergia sp. NSJ-179]